MYFGRCIAAGVFLSILAACQTAVIQREKYSDETLAAEGLRQEIERVQSFIDDAKRISDIGYPILKNSTDLCGPDWTALEDGIRLHSLDSYEVADQDVMTDGFSLTHRPTVEFVVKNSPGARADIRAGDRFHSYWGIQTTGQSGSLDALYEALKESDETAERKFEYVIERDGELLNKTLELDEICGFHIFVDPTTEINAYADGTNIFFTRGILNLLDDYSLAVVFGHEAAHNIMSHIEKHKENAAPAQVAGFALDMLFALGGVNTGGYFTKQAGEIARMQFSADFEAEADVIGMYLLARGGYPVQGAEQVWRRMAARAETSIYQETSHPPGAERYLTLQKTAEEIQAIEAKGQSLRPPLPDDWEPRAKVIPVSTELVSENER